MAAPGEVLVGDALVDPAAALPSPKIFEAAVGEEQTVAAAQDIGRVVLTEAITSLASHPEFGIRVQAALLSEEAGAIRGVWRVLRGHFNLFVDERAGQEPVDRQPAIVQMLEGLSTGNTMPTIATNLYRQGLLGNPREATMVWSALADHMKSYSSPEFRTRPEFRRQEELRKLEIAFKEQPSAVLGTALLRIAGAPQSEMSAVRAYLQPGFSGAASILTRRGLSRLSKMVGAPFHELKREVYDSDPKVIREIQARYDAQRVVLEQVLGAAVNGYSGGSKIHNQLLGRDDDPGNIQIQEVTQSGLYEMLRYYVYRHYIDVTSLMSSIGLPVPEFNVGPMRAAGRVQLTQPQIERALEAMSPETKAAKPRTRRPQEKPVEIPPELVGEVEEEKANKAAARILLPFLDGHPPRHITDEATFAAFRKLLPRLDPKMQIFLSLRIGLDGQGRRKLEQVMKEGGIAFRDIWKIKEQIRGLLSSFSEGDGASPR